MGEKEYGGFVFIDDLEAIKAVDIELLPDYNGDYHVIELEQPFASITMTLKKSSGRKLFKLAHRTINRVKRNERTRKRYKEKLRREMLKEGGKHD